MIWTVPFVGKWICGKLIEEFFIGDRADRDLMIHNCMSCKDNNDVGMTKI